VLTVFLFGEGESEQVEDWRAALERLADDQLLWLALRDPTEEDVTALQEELELGEENARRLLEQPSRASLADAGGRMHVTLYAASVEEGEPVLTSIECALGRNWIVTAHRGAAEVLEDFRERAEGGGQVVRSMPLSVVAASFEWVVAGYFRAFEAVESELEELDARVMSSTPKDVSDDLTRLVELRRSIGKLRRALSPHREVVVALAHPELDALSTEDSAEKFASLENRLTQALDAARDTKDSTFGSFDLLVARIGQRTERHHEGPNAGHGDSPSGNHARRDHGHELQGRHLQPRVAVLDRHHRDVHDRRARPLSRSQSTLDLSCT